MKRSGKWAGVSCTAARPQPPPLGGLTTPCPWPPTPRTQHLCRPVSTGGAGQHARGHGCTLQESSARGPWSEGSGAALEASGRAMRENRPASCRCPPPHPCLSSAPGKPSSGQQGGLAQPHPPTDSYGLSWQAGLCMVRRSWKQARGLCLCPTPPWASSPGSLPAGPAGLIFLARLLSFLSPGFLTSWTRLLSGGSQVAGPHSFFQTAPQTSPGGAAAHPSYSGDPQSRAPVHLAVTLPATMHSFSHRLSSQRPGLQGWNSGSEQLLISLEAAKQVNTELIPLYLAGICPPHEG